MVHDKRRARLLRERRGYRARGVRTGLRLAEEVGPSGSASAAAPRVRVSGAATGSAPRGARRDHWRDGRGRLRATRSRAAGVVTGNLVLLGIGGVRRDGSLALSAGCAVVGYLIGVLAASSGRRHKRDEEQRLWPPGVTVALICAGVLLLVFTVGWEATGGRPGREVQAVLLPIVAVAMGIQTTAVRRLGPLSTAYLTGTLTALLEGLADRHWSTEESRGVAIIIAAIAGAATATLVIDHSPAFLPLVPLVPLTVVVLASRRLIGAESCGSTTVGGKVRES